jgi:DNA replication initiation complex subunit (GINS family)
VPQRWLINLYDEVYDAWKKEQETAKLQPLAKDFYARLAGYIKKIREETKMLDEKTAKARLIKHELRNARRLIKSLVQLRYEKIFRAATAGETISIEVLTEEEERLCGKMLPLAESYKEFLQGILLGRLLLGEETKENPKRMLVRFLKDVPAIVGADMKTYGPFKIEDIGTVPTGNAVVLFKQGIAARVELE